MLSDFELTCGECIRSIKESIILKPLFKEYQRNIVNFYATLNHHPFNRTGFLLAFYKEHHPIAEVYEPAARLGGRFCFFGGCWLHSGSLGDGSMGSRKFTELQEEK
jgi:hypothetical protein